MLQSVQKTENNYSVGIVGCGWLGKALAQQLLAKNISVLATSSQLENVDKLNQQGIKALQLVLPTKEIDLAQHDVFKQSNLVIAITPQFKQGRTDYADKVISLIHAAQQGLVERIILLSSTAIYDGLTGLVDENSKLDLETEKVKILNAAEQAVLNFSKQEAEQKTQQGIVLRLAGLVGPERHPGKFILANKTLNNSTAPVNLIHQQDTVGLIELLLKAPFSQDKLCSDNNTQVIYNGVSDTHVSKQQYYQAAAKALGLNPPRFSKESVKKTTRIVCGKKAKQVLGYNFIYPNLLTWV